MEIRHLLCFLFEDCADNRSNGGNGKKHQEFNISYSLFNDTAIVSKVRRKIEYFQL